MKQYVRKAQSKVLKLSEDKLPLNKINPLESFIFPKNFKLLDNVTEIFELELAFYELQTLNRNELIERSAYFEKIDDQETMHYKLCKEASSSLWENRSSATAKYFRNGLFSTGYATHGLFPYRGKFHPQLIKALMNIIGIQKGDLVLDPMCGSGTLNVEASLSGMNSIGIEKNPFACFMAKVKTESLRLDEKLLNECIQNKEKVSKELVSKQSPDKRIINSDHEIDRVKRLFLLAYLDAMGYARRTEKGIDKLFPIVLNRYLNQVKHFLKVSNNLKLSIGRSKIEFGDARIMNTVNEESIDGVITSPPYSFAIDYAENDKPQIEYLGFNVQKLREEMIGLQGKTIKEKIEKYFSDMQKVASEIYRVLKKDKYAIIIIGINDIQTKGIRLEEKIKEIAIQEKLKLIKEIRKPIKGLRNTMNEEFIEIFKKVE